MYEDANIMNFRMTVLLYNEYDSEDLIGQYLKYYDNGFISDNEYQECGFLIRNNFHIKSKGFSMNGKKT